MTRLRTGLLLSLVLAGCTEVQPGRAADPERTNACLSPDSLARRNPLVYADFSVDTLETWDISGTRLFLRRDSIGWTGEYQNAEGEWGSIDRGVRIDGNLADGTITLHIPHGPQLPDTTRFRGSFSCDSIWGVERVYSGQPERRATYIREPSGQG